MTKQVQERTLLTVAGVADRWSCSRQYVYRLIYSGKLRTVRLGRGVRVPVAVADDYVAKLPGAKRAKRGAR